MSDYTKQLQTIPISGNDVENIRLSSSDTNDLENNSSPSNSPFKSKLSSLFTKVKGYVKLSTSENEQQQSQKQNSFLFKVSQYCQIEKSYKIFLLFLFLGIGITIFSFLFLPMAILAPKKFVSLFSLGCTTTIFSFIFYYGTYDFLSILFNPERRNYSILFFISTIFGLYFSFFVKSYFILSLICTAVQFVIVIIFTLSFIPGGKSGISFILNLISSPIKKFCNSMKK